MLRLGFQRRGWAPEPYGPGAKARLGKLERGSPLLRLESAILIGGWRRAQPSIPPPGLSVTGNGASAGSRLRGAGPVRA